MLLSSAAATCILTLLLLLSQVNNVTAGLSWYGRNEVQAASVTDTAEPDIVIMDRMQKALDVVNNIRSQPSSCKRIAGTRLTNFCATHNGARSGEATDIVLGRAQELFAVRMTQCTLEDALQEQKPACRPLLRSDVNGGNLGRQLQLCKDALYNDPPAWTTFENLKSDGLTMCYAMRREIEKDEQLELFNAMFSAFYGLNHTMEQHQASFEHFRVQFADLQVAMRDLHEDLRTELSAVSLEMETLSQTTDQARRDFEDLFNQVQKQFESAKVYGTQMNGEYETGLLRLQEHVETAHSKYQYNLEMFLAATHQQMYAVTNNIQDANIMASHLLDNLSVIDLGLAASTVKLQGFDDQLDATTSKQQGVNQNFDTLQSKINASREQVEALNEQTGRSLEVLVGVTNWATKACKQLGRVCFAFLIYFALATYFVFCMVPQNVWLVNRGLTAIISGTVSAILLTANFPGLIDFFENLLYQGHIAPASPVKLNSKFVGIFSAGVFAGAIATYLIQRHRRPRCYDPQAPRLHYPIPEYDEDIENGKIHST